MDRFSWLTSFSVWLVLGMTAMFVTSHVSLLWLLRLYKYEQIHPVTWYFVLFILLTVPWITDLVYWFWTTPIINTSSKEKLPAVRNIFLGVLSSILEGSATAAFGAEVAHVLPEPVLLTLPFSVSAFAVLKDTIAFVKNPSRQMNDKTQQGVPLRRIACVVLSCVLTAYPFLVTSVVGIVLCLGSQFELSAAQVIVASTCVFLLTTAWYPEVVTLTLLSPVTGNRCSRVQLIYNCVKVVSCAIALFLSLEFKMRLFREYPYNHLTFALHQSAQLGVFVPMVLCCFGGLFSFLLSVAASKVSLVTPALPISMFLSPPLAIAMSAVLWNDFDTGAFWEVTAGDLNSWLAVTLSSGVWLSFLFAPAFQGLRNPIDTNRKLAESFYSFSWCVLFLEAKLGMNYERESVHEPKSQLHPRQKELENRKRQHDCKTVFICTTMYKETEKEMSRYLRSIKSTFDYDWGKQNIDVEAHVIFDSSISDNGICPRGRHFLYLLCEMFDIQSEDLCKFSTPYGCQIRVRNICKDHAMFVHFKDTTKVKAKKRWSQVMYMHYLLQFRTQNRTGGKETRNGWDRKLQLYLKSRDNGAPETLSLNDLPVNIDIHGEHSYAYISSAEPISKHGKDCGGLPLSQVYLLTTDADTEFSAACVSRVLSLCSSGPSLGAVCGRTVPAGSAKPIVWYQKFEYAKDFWLVKSSQNIIGSVTCCPGCFSVYRGEALSGVVHSFSQPALSAFQSLVMDHGEDRWLCTLLMQHGWRLAYSCSARNSTHCPETVGEFLRQRRRWVLSELSNMAAIFLSLRSLVRDNSSFSVAFLISLFTTLLWVVVSPVTTLVCVCAGMAVLCFVPLSASLPAAAAMFAGYCLVCWFGSQGKQKIASLGLTLVMAGAVLTLAVSFLVYVTREILDANTTELHKEASVEFRPYVLVLLMSGYAVYAAMLHPNEATSLVYGATYALLFPAIFVALPVYALANMLDQSWGTREAGTHGCCQEPESEESQDDFKAFAMQVSDLPSLATERPEEELFWHALCRTYIGNDVNVGKCSLAVTEDLRKLRIKTMFLFLVANCVWGLSLIFMFVFAGSDIIYYLLMAAFSFSLLLQLTGLTCYKVNLFLERYLSKGNSISE